MARKVEDLKMLQSLLKEMLEVIDGICREEKIPYMLWGGSCLGAVREHDIIPWDDDLDIIVWRKDKNRIEEALRKKLPERFCLVTPEDNYPYFHDFMTRVENKDYLLHEPTEADKAQDNRQNHVFIDVFTLDCTGRSQAEVKVRKYIYWFIWMLSMGHRYELDLNAYGGKATQFAVKLVTAAGRLIPMPVLKKLRDSFCTQIKPEGACYVGRYDTVFAGVKVKKKTKYDYRRSWFARQRLVRFGDRKYPVPAGFDRYLTHEYGEYMKPVNDSSTYEKHYS